MKALASSSAKGWTEVEPTTLSEPFGNLPADPVPAADDRGGHRQQAYGINTNLFMSSYHLV